MNFIIFMNVWGFQTCNCHLMRCVSMHCNWRVCMEINWEGSVLQRIQEFSLINERSMYCILCILETVPQSQMLQLWFRNLIDILRIKEEAQNKWMRKWMNYKIYGVDYFIGSNVKFNDYQAMFCWQHYLSVRICASRAVELLRTGWRQRRGHQRWRQRRGS